MIAMAFPTLKDKLVLITGAGSGIGYEMVLAFAREGCTVIATDIQEAALETVKAEAESLGASCFTHRLDVTDRDAWLALADRLAADNHNPDVLINNAGIAYIAGLLETTPQMLDRTLDINVKGVIYGCQAFIPAMRASDTPKQIVNVASAASKAPMPNMSIYAGSKFAVEGISDVIAMELNDSHIGVLCAHPGIIDTPIVKNRAMIGASISDDQIERLQNHYSTKGCHPSVVAQDIVMAVKKGNAAVLTGPSAFTGALLSRLLPKRLLRSVIAKMAPGLGYL
jgi:NAD(P)-dependent dehydrogenase (short-subunit alcohol dehydrogenase family)